VFNVPVISQTMFQANLLTGATKTRVLPRTTQNQTQPCKNTTNICITLSRPLLLYGYNYQASCPRLGKAVICNFWHPGTLMLSPERLSPERQSEKLQMMA